MQWERALRGADPCMSLIVFNTEDQAENQSICWEEIGFAIVWKPPQGLLNQVCELGGALSCGLEGTAIGRTDLNMALFIWMAETGG